MVKKIAPEVMEGFDSSMLMNVKSMPILTWQKSDRRRGQPLRIPSAGDDHKFMVFGGVEYGSGQVTFREEERKNSTSFIGWLEEVEQMYPTEKVLVVLDNVGYHKSRQCLEWWQAQQEHIRPFFLPAYAPHT